MDTCKKDFRLKTTTDRREYKRIIKWEDPWDESERFCIRTVNSGCAGYWKKRQLYPSEYRASRTWKHNRKTQYK